MLPGPHAWVFMWMWKPELRTSRLHSNHAINWAISPAPYSRILCSFYAGKTLTTSHAYNPQSLGGRGRRIKSSRQLQLSLRPAWIAKEPVSILLPSRKTKLQMLSHLQNHPEGKVSCPFLQRLHWADWFWFYSHTLFRIDTSSRESVSKPERWVLRRFWEIFLSSPSFSYWCDDFRKWPAQSHH